MDNFLEVIPSPNDLIYWIYRFLLYTIIVVVMFSKLKSSQNML